MLRSAERTAYHVDQTATVHRSGDARVISVISVNQELVHVP